MLVQSFSFLTLKCDSNDLTMHALELREHDHLFTQIHTSNTVWFKIWYCSSLVVEEGGGNRKVTKICIILLLFSCIASFFLFFSFFNISSCITQITPSLSCLPNPLSAESPLLHNAPQVCITKCWSWQECIEEPSLIRQLHAKWTQHHCLSLSHTFPAQVTLLLVILEMFLFSKHCFPIVQHDVRGNTDFVLTESQLFNFGSQR